MIDQKSRRIGSYMGKGYLDSAFLFAEMAKGIESLNIEDIRFIHLTHESFVKSSIIASACYMEVTINEWYSVCDRIKKNSKNKKTLQTMAALWSLGIPRTASYPILKKFQIALTQLGLENFDEGAEPYQSASAVIDIRNWLVHYEMTMEPIETKESLSRDKAHKLKNKLNGKFPLNPLCATWAPFWPLKCLGSGCALWAANSTFLFVNEFFKKTSKKHFMRFEDKRISAVRKIGLDFIQTALKIHSNGQVS